jgi:hypothetical protein
VTSITAAGGAWTPGVVAACGLDHAGRGAGVVDETPRRLSHAEFAVARLLAAEGHEVRALAERPGRARTADLDVCGQPVEVKSWVSLEERGGRTLTPKSVVNKLVQAHGQSASVVVYAGGSGLTDVTARAGLAAYACRSDSEQLAAVRVIGDGFDLAMTRLPGLERAAAVDRLPDRSPSALQGLSPGWTLM